MADQQAPPDSSPTDASERSLNDDVRQLAEDARILAEAEFEYQKSRAAFAGSEVPKIAAFALIAAVFVFFALMAAILGTVIALAPLLSAWGAMAAVTLGLVLIAILLALFAFIKWKRMKAIVSDEEDS